MRPGTRSAGHNKHRSSGSNRLDVEVPNDLNASSPPEPVGTDFEGADAVRLHRFATQQQQHHHRYYADHPPPALIPQQPQQLQQSQTDVARRISQHTSIPIRDPPLDVDVSAEEGANLLSRSPTLCTPTYINKPYLRDGRVRIRPRICSLLSILFACLALISLGLIAHSFLNLQRDPKGCRMSFMYPSYAKLKGFDTEHTRFATKYSLYLYREQHIDLSLEVGSRSATLNTADWRTCAFHTR
jgi:hypothetical protein